MDEATQRFARESVILLKMLGEDLQSEVHTQLTLRQAKTVKRAATVLVQDLARHRDKLQPGGTSTDEREQDHRT